MNIIDVLDHNYSHEGSPMEVVEISVINSPGTDKARKMDKRKKMNRSKNKDIEKPFGCTDCHKRFTRKGDMYRHLRTHTGERPYSCPECGDMFSRKDDMVRHLRTHTGLKPFDCTNCDRKFSRRSDLYKHMVLHAGVKVKNPGCPTCGCQKSDHCGGGTEAPVVRKRGRPKGSTGSVLHKCNVCSKSFTRKRDLVRHVRSHTLLDIVKVANKGNTGRAVAKNDKDLSTKIQQIDSKFSQENLQVVQVEEVENGYVDEDGNNLNEIIEQAKAAAGSASGECKVVVISADALANGIDPEAFQIFATNKALQNALLGIKTDKPFPCPQCGDKFGRKSDMVRHLRIHSGVKPFNCNLCGRPFSRREDMNRHVLTHSGVKPYSCSLCTKSFARKSDFEMHTSVHVHDISPVCEATIVTRVEEVEEIEAADVVNETDDIEEIEEEPEET